MRTQAARQAILRADPKASEPRLTCGTCDHGWICEAHPDRPWPHDDCTGPGIPCDVPTCPYRIDVRPVRTRTRTRLPAVSSAGGDRGARDGWIGDGVSALREPVVVVGRAAALTMHWTSPNHRPPPAEPPRPTLLEPAWRATSPTGKLLACALYRGESEMSCFTAVAREGSHCAFVPD